MSLRLSRILHAGYNFESSETHILFDPIFENPFSRNCYSFPEIQFDIEQIQQLKPDAVFISHYHDDHCSFESLKHINREAPIYMYCLHEEIFEWLNQLGFEKVYPLTIGVSIHIKDIEVLPIRALDVDVDCMFHIKHKDINVLNVVDSWIDYETIECLAKHKWQCVLWPFQTMREVEILSPSRFEPSDRQLPVEWIEQLQKLKPFNVVPSSCQFQMEPWSWQNHFFFPISYDGFNKQIESVMPNTIVTRIDPGCSFVLDSAGGFQKSERLNWVHPVGDQSLDYSYSPTRTVPHTSVIAAQFPDLNEAQMQIVKNYCEEGILKRYREVFKESEPEAKATVWQLSLYDKSGTETKFQYELQGDKIRKLDKFSDFTWLTEIPAFKLYSSVTSGESLTSLYLRVNDYVFSDEREAELKSLDVLSDPLIACLFTAEFGTYQKAQLQKLFQC